MLGNVRLLYPLLIECDLERWEAPQGADDENPERYYDAGLKRLTREGQKVEGQSKNFALAACLFTAGLKEKKTKTVEVSATYLVGVDCEGDEDVPEADSKTLLEQMAKSSAWPLFRAVFIHLGSQSGLELPLLPNEPKLRWLKLDETSEEPEVKNSA